MFLLDTKHLHHFTSQSTCIISHQLSYQPYLHHMVGWIHVSPSRKPVHPHSDPCHHHQCPPPSGTATFKTGGVQNKKRWHGILWVMRRCTSMRALKKSHTRVFWAFFSSVCDQREWLPSYQVSVVPLHSDPLSLGRWWVSPTQPCCSLWLGHSEDVGDAQAEKESTARSSCFINTKMSSFFKHHIAIFWTYIYEPVSTFPWLEKEHVVLWIQLGDMVSPAAQRKVLSLS